MTDKPTPTDAELKAMWQLHAADIGGIFCYARAALAKWGQPAQKTVTVVPDTGDVWLKHDDDLRYVRRVLEAGRQMTDVDQRAAIDIVQGLRVTARSMAVDAKKPAQAEEPFCWHWENTFNGGTGTVKKNPETLGINMSHPDYKWTALYTAPQPTQPKE